MAIDPESKHRHLPRLGAEHYRGLAFVHWTMAMKHRRQGWLNGSWFDAFCADVLPLCLRYDVAIPALVAMPDHLHVLVAGTSLAADQRLFMRGLRRRLNQRLAEGIELQKQAYDHVLRPVERGPDAFSTLIYYITQNPVRKGLVKDTESWPYVISVVPGVDDFSPTRLDFSTRWWTWWNEKVSTMP